LSILNFQLGGFGLFINYFHGFGLGFSSGVYSFYIDWFHNFNCCLIFGVLVYVFIVLYYLFVGGAVIHISGDYRWGEFFCGVVPVIILIIQILPSLGLLYYYGLMSLSADLGLKIIGHQ
jgi:hypothetical protein